MKHRIGPMCCAILTVVLALLNGCAQGPMAPSRFGTTSQAPARAEFVDARPAPVSTAAEPIQSAPVAEPSVSAPVPVAPVPSETKPSFFQRLFSSKKSADRFDPADLSALRSDAVSQVHIAAASEDALSRCHAMECYAILGDRAAMLRLRRGLSDVSASVRYAAAVGCGDCRDSGARVLLEPLLRDSSALVKLAAAYALERIGDQRFGTWYDLVLDGDDAPLAGAACWLLGKLGHTALRTDSDLKLWAVLKKKHQYPSVRLQAAEALARLGDERILSQLLVFAGSYYADDRIMAVEGLRHIDDVNAYSMLLSLTEDPQIEVRLAAASALGPRAESGDRQLVRAAMDYDGIQGDALSAARVRGLALLALGRIGTADDGAVLKAALHDANAYVQIAAAHGVLELTDRLGAASGSGSGL